MGYLSVASLGLAIILTYLCLLVTLLPLLASNHWICRIWEFPRVQLVVISTLNATVLATLNDSYFGSLVAVSLVVNILLIIFQGHWIMPYSPLFKKEVPRTTGKPNHTLSILTSNVLMTNRDTSKLIKHIAYHQPDIIVTLESDIWWQQRLDDALNDYPHRVAAPQDNLYGMHVYSKLSLHSVDINYLIKPSIPSIECDAELPNGQLIKCFFLHPEPPSPTEAETANPRDRELLLYAKRAGSKTLPVIVSGDLNDVAWSPTTKAFRKQSGLLDPRIGRGFFNTFHAHHWWARWPLDHIFVSEEFSLKSIKRLEDIGSDHFPLLTELGIEKGG